MPKPITKAELEKLYRESQTERERYKDAWIDRRDKVKELETEIGRLHTDILRDRDEKERWLLEILRWAMNPENSRDPWNHLLRAKTAKDLRDQFGNMNGPTLDDYLGRPRY